MQPDFPVLDFILSVENSNAWLLEEVLYTVEENHPARMFLNLTLCSACCLVRSVLDFVVSVLAFTIVSRGLNSLVSMLCSSLGKYRRS